MLLTSFVLSAALAAAPAKPKTAKPAPTPVPTAASEKGSAVARPAGGDVIWARTWDEAVASAKKMGDGRILIEFTDSRCGDCLRLESLVIPSTSFFAMTRDKVPVQIDRTTEEGKRLAQRFGITALPAWVITTPDLVLCGIQMGSTNQSGFFSTFAHTEDSWAAYKKKLADEEKAPNEDLAFDIAKETFKRGGDVQAEPRFRKLASTASKQTLREQSLAYLASIELDAGRIDDAARDLDVLLSSAQDPALKEKAELRRADVDIARGRQDLAARRLSAFKKLHPSSPLVKDVDAILAALKQRGFTAED